VSTEKKSPSRGKERESCSQELRVRRETLLTALGVREKGGYCKIQEGGRSEETEGRGESEGGGSGLIRAGGEE